MMEAIRRFFAKLRARFGGIQTKYEEAKTDVEEKIQDTKQKIKDEVQDTKKKFKDTLKNDDYGE